jgi:polysaccharide export outer membrane protein
MRTSAALLVLALAACSGAETASPAAPARPGTDEPPPNAFLSVPPPADPAPSLPKLPPPPPVTLTSGDLVFISVFRQKDLELEVRIPEGGSFAYPLIGEVRAAGRTLKEVEAELRARLEEKYLKRASVTLTVREFAPRMVYVLGGVAKPSGYEYPVSRRFTVLQLISAAGGFTDRAQKEYAQLLRRREGGERELVRFSVAEVEKAVARGRVDADLELAPDDLLVIPSAARVVYVLGQVNKPGSFELPADTRVTVSMAVSQAGSWTKFASISRIQVLRQPPTGEPVRFAVDLDQVVNGRIDLDVEVHPGDVVWVPQRSLF